MLAPTLDTVLGMRHGRDRPRKRPSKPHADKAEAGLARSCRALLARGWTAAKGWAATDGRRTHAGLTQPRPPPAYPSQTVGQYSQGSALPGVDVICRNQIRSFVRFSQSRLSKPCLRARSTSIFTLEGCHLSRPRGVRSRISSRR